MAASRDRSDAVAPASPDTPASVFPDLVLAEFLAALLCSVALLAWSLLQDAPLLAVANPTTTENPAKAPWYFVGLQELLVYFDPWIAGVVLPTLIIVGLMMIPYLDTSRDAVGRYTWRSRRLAVRHFLFGFGLWWALIAVGQLLRGPNWQFYLPWQDWGVPRNAAAQLWSFPWWLGLPTLLGYFGGGFLLLRRRWPGVRAGLGPTRWAIVATLVLLLYAVPIKILLRLVLGTQYVLVTPWFNV